MYVSTVRVRSRLRRLAGTLLAPWFAIAMVQPAAWHTCETAGERGAHAQGSRHGTPPSRTTAPAQHATRVHAVAATHTSALAPAGHTVGAAHTAPHAPASPHDDCDCSGCCCCLTPAAAAPRASITRLASILPRTNAPRMHEGVGMRRTAPPYLRPFAIGPPARG
ncbi:MAG: hypothetical protein MUF00_08200 [Gemmatimonadaceae bacterium]|nr:hypothetical protein [Gemmatimonadaceae bacterium]